MKLRVVGWGKCLQNQLKDPDNATYEKKFQKLVEDANTPVYDNVGINNNVLEVTLELLRIKAKSGLSDKGFTEMLSYLATVFPEGNKLPKSTYEAKKITCPLGLHVVKYHACPLDYIVYTGPHKNKDKCPICGTSRYKKKDGNHDEVDEEEVSKGRPAKIVWYLPMGSRFERWFQNLKDAVRLVYHDPSEKMYDADGEYRTDNTEAGILKHPADVAQWRTLDAEFPDFASDPRKLRLGLSTDGINPFGNMSSTHSTWPLVKDELAELWNTGRNVWDARREEYFTLRAALLTCVHDYPANGNTSCQCTKVYKACTKCAENTISEMLPTSRKIVYMGHRRWLHPKDPWRLDAESFNGKEEDEGKPREKSGFEIYDIVKDLEVRPGKAENVKDKDGPDTSMWKRRSVFWGLPYWPHLRCRHNVDVMHVEKNVCDSVLGLLMNIPDKKKDGPKARKDLEILKIRKELWVEEEESPEDKNGFVIVSKDELHRVCECFRGIKLLLVAIRGAMEPGILCEFEKYFPPTFFDVMVHLMVHIVDEILVLKRYVRNRGRPEGSILQGYLVEECVEFCTDWLADQKAIGVPESRHKGKLAGQGLFGQKYIEVHSKRRAADFNRTHLVVLQHIDAVRPYQEMHMQELQNNNPTRGQIWIHREHSKHFAEWLKEYWYEREPVDENEKTVLRLSREPAYHVATWQAYAINGYTYYTKSQDCKSQYQNSGVVLVSETATDSQAKTKAFYGVIEEIWDLDYSITMIPLFRVRWATNGKPDGHRFTTMMLPPGIPRDQINVEAIPATQEP
ncbi:uncharacterized protein LOC100825465 [Brachypodium distachyon]|uniref:uncharacterized protein LOC100825465 n=1 Tax=Brachypodium distachyon TaxID=15368 RepID=UPI00052FE2BE|nr:uncharacterized protein LOC100825465 [Brachypodium distachyon]|eukprot:XP_010229687.1 uncharacterized protein LOC100825465 [Brachypodium distachyon]